MRASEFLFETSDGEFDPVYQAAIKNAVHFPDQNMSTGSAYLNYRFGIAMAGAPDYPTKAAGSISGDPLMSTYTDEELHMINAAAKMVGSKGMKKLSNNRSTEIPNTNVKSPLPQNSGKNIKRKS